MWRDQLQVAFAVAEEAQDEVVQDEEEEDQEEVQDEEEEDQEEVQDEEEEDQEEEDEPPVLRCPKRRL